MVLKSTRRSARYLELARNILIFIICMATSYTALRFLIGQSLTEFVQTNIIAPLRQKSTFIDFQPLVDDFAATRSEKVSVLIYDLDNQKRAGEHRANVPMSTASLYKLRIAYEEYRRMDAGELSRNTKITNGHTRLECLDLVLRESDSPCAETLAAKDNIYFSLSASADEILNTMLLYYYHDTLSTDSWERIQDAMLNQPVKNGYDWRQGLPQGFSVAKVYNKVGWAGENSSWTIYNDAAIVDFQAKKRHFIVIVMTNNTDPSVIKSFGQDFEKIVLGS